MFLWRGKNTLSFFNITFLCTSGSLNLLTFIFNSRIKALSKCTYFIYIYIHIYSWCLPVKFYHVFLHFLFSLLMTQPIALCTLFNRLTATKNAVFALNLTNYAVLYLVCSDWMLCCFVLNHLWCCCCLWWFRWFLDVLMLKGALLKEPSSGYPSLLYSFSTVSEQLSP